MRLILIRHGETDWNVMGRYQGQADPALNENGISQAHELAAVLTAEDLMVVYTSPLLRATQTAEILSERLSIPMCVDPRFMEIHQGDWEARLRSEIEELYPDLFRRWEAEPWEVTPPQGEHLSEVQVRVYAAIDDLARKYPGKSVGLVAHRIPIALIKMRYQGLDKDIVRTLHLPNAYFEEIFIETSSK